MLDAYLLERVSGGRTLDNFWAHRVEGRCRGPTGAQPCGRSPTDPTLLQPLWDSAIQDQDVAFESLRHWLLDAIEWARRTPDIDLVIRIHPAEVHIAIHPTREQMADVIAAHVAALPENVRVVAPDSPISSYTLMRAASVGLVYSSTSGLEMATLGLPVVAAAAAHFTRRGFTSDPSDRDAYWATVEALIAGPPGDLERARVRELARPLLTPLLVSVPPRARCGARGRAEQAAGGGRERRIAGPGSSSRARRGRRRDPVGGRTGRLLVVGSIVAAARRTEPVRVLAMDHYFDQDLRALEDDPRLEVRRFPYQRLRQPALRIMGESAADGLRGYNRRELAPQRRRYARWLEREVRRLYLERAFDVLVVPSDTFFYVRSLPAAAHTLGLPVVVVQKETTISADTMEAHSPEMREEAPFIADYMTVCSERHREFWIRAGGDPRMIEVTGQPRFDLYASSGTPPPRSRKTVLFLSYDLDAYVPVAEHHHQHGAWASLREETEQVLFAAVRTRACDVIVKFHPQQNHRVEVARLARRAGAHWGLGLSAATEGADTRGLIVAADVVVGFQTTALYEAVAAHRPTIVAAWGNEYERFRQSLIPLHEAPRGCVYHASSADDLAALLSRPLSPPPRGCSDWYEEALGPVDGRATERVATRLEAIAAAWSPTAQRRELEARRSRYAAGLLIRSLAAEAWWTAGTPLAHIAGQERRVSTRRRRAREGRDMATATLRRALNRDAD